jgi:hypothetical protein
MEKSSVRKRGSHNCYIAPVIMWNRMSRCGPAWTLRMTASAEGSSQPTDCRDVVATRVGKDLGTDGVRRSRTAILKACERSGKPAFRDKDAVARILDERKGFHQGPAADCTEFGQGFARKIEGLSPTEICMEKGFSG